MTVKKSYLDEKIINVARKEFLKYGYRNASLHKIVEKAGTTTGALYTRYKNKDDLFVSLVKNVASIIKDHSRMVMCENLGIQEPHDIQTISGVIKKRWHFTTNFFQNILRNVTYSIVRVKVVRLTP